VNFIVDRGLIEFHFRPVDAANLITMLRGTGVTHIKNLESMLPITSRFNFCLSLFRFCSVTTIDRFFRKQLDARVKHGFAGGMFPLYLIHAALMATWEAEKNDAKSKEYTFYSK